jgi:hypothetical protein
MTDEELIAEARVRAYLARRAIASGCDPEHIHGYDVSKDNPEGISLTVSDLTALLDALAAARQDAKAAEDELEMQEQEACMMENDYLKLEKERDALEAKLAKAVEAAGKMLDAFCVHEDSHQSAAYEAMCAAPAETERESHE